MQCQNFRQPRIETEDAPLKTLVAPQVAPLRGWQLAQYYVSDAHALESGDLESVEMARIETQRRGVTLEARLRADERNRGPVPLLGLTRHVADRLVNEYRYACVLPRLRGLRQRNPLGRINARAELGDHHAVDKHPTAFNIAVGLAARAQTLLGHQFGDADFFHCSMLKATACATSIPSTAAERMPPA